MARLELRNASKSYGKTVAVKDIDLVVEDNEFFCIFGPPSSGKTTILRLLLGLVAPDEGEITIGGVAVGDQGPKERNLAMVFQNLALFPHMTAGQNLAFPLVERKLEKAAVMERVAEVAETLHITPLLDKLPAHLSGGERQRVAIGRALVRDPAAFLMDEPIAALDARLREEMRVGAQAPPARASSHDHLRDPRPGRGDVNCRSHCGDGGGRNPPDRHAGRNL